MYVVYFPTLLEIASIILSVCEQHCDIKPDNWVLTSSSTDDSVSNSVGGADLMLVDFGRSIDLSYAAVSGSDPLEDSRRPGPRSPDLLRRAAIPAQRAMDPASASLRR